MALSRFVPLFGSTGNKKRLSVVGIPSSEEKANNQSLSAPERTSMDDDINCSRLPAQEAPHAYHPAERDYAKGFKTPKWGVYYHRSKKEELDDYLDAIAMLFEEYEKLGNKAEVQRLDAAGKEDSDSDDEGDEALTSSQLFAAVQKSEDSSDSDDEDQAEKYHCEVCWDALPIDKFPTRTPSTNCDMNCGTRCCFVCLASSIYNFSQENHWRDIKCPICYAQMTYEDVTEFGPEHVVESYDRHTLLSALSDIPTFRFCASSNCEFGQIHPSISAKEEVIAIRIKCSSCEVVSCSKHNVPWHTNETCEQFDERIANANKGQERRSKRKVARISKRCPREGCLHRINKDGGCYHMTCVCKHEFCWDCLAEYPSHKWTCPKRGHSFSFRSILDHLIIDPIVWPLQRRYQRRQERRREMRENRVIVEDEA